MLIFHLIVIVALFFAVQFAIGWWVNRSRVGSSESLDAVTVKRRRSETIVWFTATGVIFALLLLLSVQVVDEWQASGGKQSQGRSLLERLQN